MFDHVTIATGQAAVEYIQGRFNRVLGPGRYRRRRHATFTTMSTIQTLTVAGPQEIPTADGVTVRATVVTRWRVADPRAFAETANDPWHLVHLAIQVALRDAIASVEVEQAMAAARSDAVADLLTAQARTAGAGVGIEVDAVVIRDLLLPAELRSAYAAKIAAKAQGLATLELARAETAALRSLANGAKLLDEHPGLARLRLVQALPIGSTVKITAGV